MNLVGVEANNWKATAHRIDRCLSNGEMHLLTGVFVDAYFSPSDSPILTGSADMGIIAGIMAVRFKDAKDTSDLCFCGEVEGLRFRPLQRPLAVGKAAKDAGRVLVCPASSAPLARMSGARVIGVTTPADLARVVCGARPYVKKEAEVELAPSAGVDMRYVKGQERGRRAVEIAVAGGHNLLLVGPPGEGKSLLAKVIPTIAPELTIDQALETTAIYQSQNLIDSNQMIIQPPLRTVDPTVTRQALLGGGHLEPYPGEVSLAHNGVLFADEILQFTRNTLEALRTPLQDNQISISRVHWKVTFPARFQLVGAANPCPCGYWNHPSIPCRCTPSARRRYAQKLSGPLMDRIDIKVWIDPLGEERFSPANGEPSEVVAKRIQRARQLQEERYNDREIATNADLGPDTMHLAKLSNSGRERLRDVVESHHLSTRGMDNLIKVSRTIADLAGSETVEPYHIEEAVSYLSVPLPLE